jgi:hypothetical protein
MGRACPDSGRAPAVAVVVAGAVPQWEIAVDADLSTSTCGGTRALASLGACARTLWPLLGVATGTAGGRPVRSSGA